MKTVILASIGLMLGLMIINRTPSTAAGNETAVFKVYGNCEMCKDRIEGSLKGVKGVQSASWDVNSKKMKVTFDPSVVSSDAIQKKIASVGHDTEKVTAATKTYEGLPGCCQYDRKK
ncbi:MAG: heavy-metal-associated domain-containing protein [Cytophagales bacterium]|nr:heavy-metal-associated domain-containing protein [Cytophagales bacterium]